MLSRSLRTIVDLIGVPRAASSSRLDTGRLARVAGFIVLWGVLAAGCGSSSSKTTTNTSAALLASPGPRPGSIAKKVPVYAGDPAAKQEPKGSSALNRLPVVNRPNPTAATPRIRGSAGLSTAQWLDAVDNDVGNFWQNQFNAVHLLYIPLTEQIFTTGTFTCTGDPHPVTVDTGANYCPGNATMYLPLPWFEKLIKPYGDTALAVVVAHENGHHIQDLLNLRFNTGINLELQADCLAGYWAASVYQRGELQPGDIGEALKVSGKFGDTSQTGPSHGTGMQRQQAFLRGYNTGRAGDCTVYQARS
jgi:uncharacterized protein